MLNFYLLLIVNENNDVDRVDGNVNNEPHQQQDRSEGDIEHTTEESMSSSEQSETPSPPPQPPQRVEPPRPSVFQVTLTFFKTLVTSLIPTAPPPIQQN